MKYKNVKTDKTVIKQINSFCGVNTADVISKVKENQLRECVNLWNPNGSLESRMGLKTENGALHLKNTESSFLRVYESTLPPFKAGEFSRIGAIAEVSGTFSTVSSYLLDKNGNKKIIAPLQYVGPTGNRVSDIQNVVFISGEKIKSDGIFMVVTLLVYDQTTEKRIMYYELNSSLDGWELIDKKDFYIPTILRYGRGNNYQEAEKKEKYKIKQPEELEEINILNGAFRVCFSLDEVSSAFYLPVKRISMADGDVVVIDYAVSPVQNKIITVASSQNSVDVELFGQSIKIEVDRLSGTICFLTQDGNPYPLPRYGGENSLKITAYKYDNDKAFELFCNSASLMSFDGRVVRLGSFESCHKVFYSGKDNPFYFCMGASISVGEKQFALTALAAQNRYLFLFKENEIYRLRLEESESYDINEIVENDLSANVGFPKHTLTVVHSTIGCDCPQSLAFCTNRLVWYHSDGFVYCLYGTNNYTEGSVYVLSPNISDKLKTNIADKHNVSATCYEGYYFLSIMNRIYIMDALVSGFRYLSGLKTDMFGGGGLSWYIWEMPKNVSVFSLNCVSGKLFAVLLYNEEYERGVLFFSEFSKEALKDTVMVAYNETDQKEIEVEFASALVMPNTMSKLKRVSLDIQNSCKLQAELFSNSFSGKRFFVKENKTMKKRSVVIPPYSAYGAGIRFTTKAPISINSLEFEFDVRGK